MSNMNNQLAPYEQSPNSQQGAGAYGNSRVGPPVPYGGSQVGPPSGRYSSNRQLANTNQGGQSESQIVPAGKNQSQQMVVRPYDDDQYHDGSKQRGAGAGGDNYDDEDDGERRHKYTTANMKRGNCRKYFCIALMFLIFIGISIGISQLINYIFFRDDKNKGGGAAAAAQRGEDETFREDKSTMDGACSTSAFDENGGLACKEACLKDFFECCDPFNEYTLYNISNDPLTDPDYAGNCSLPTELRGCVSYSKCQAASGYNDPAPLTLPVLCRDPRLTENPQACNDICTKQSCCYRDGRNCRAQNFDVCLDYAPCQNLRPTPDLYTAPANLDNLCFTEDEQCGFECEKAACCNLEAEDSCFANNVITCMTYAACTESNLTATNITIPEQFSHVPVVPERLLYACTVSRDENAADTMDECADLCQQSACCRAENPAYGCFLQDPLGCMEWNSKCQNVVSSSSSETQP